ncbi:MAG: terpene cyclase/mutase family protein [Planctomycetota bacterium]|nr:terpene cyclase/mutase family protein [Planctomycetota bacterium]
MASFSFAQKTSSKKFFLLVTTLVCFATGSSHTFAQKYTPDHPVVQDMVAKGIAFLGSSRARTTGEGMHYLMGYTLFKVDGNTEHPVVASAIAESRELARVVASGGKNGDTRSMYVPALAGMLLASVDVEAYGAEIRQIRDFLLASQKPHGGFGYLVDGQYLASGDISQTQYAMLCLWTMSQLGIEVPDEAIIRTISFLAASQHNDGAWPYQAGTGTVDAATSNSLAAAGFSALLIAGDLLGQYRSKIAENQEEEGIIPAAFKRILADTGKTKANFDRTRLDNSAKRGEAWHNQNPYKRAIWHYYYMYSRERYESFLEITKGKQQKSPEWYNQAVEALRAAQSTDGNFAGAWGAVAGDTDSLLNPEASTCFAVLFLIRSTQKAIGSLNEAYYVGGQGLPDDLNSVTVNGGKVVSKSTATSVDDALKMLEQDGKGNTEGKLVADNMKLSSDPKQRKDQLNRFTRLLNAKEAESRKVAAKMLGRGDDMDVVPSLIFAVSTDPDAEVARTAEQSLRLISRKLDTYHLPKSKDGKLSDQAKIKAGAEWKKWYLSLRPDYVFND